MIAFSAVWVIFMIDKDLILSRLLSLIQVMNVQEPHC
jgi:hypothetical protein